MCPNWNIRPIWIRPIGSMSEVQSPRPITPQSCQMPSELIRKGTTAIFSCPKTMTFFSASGPNRCSKRWHSEAGLHATGIVEQLRLAGLRRGRASRARTIAALCEASIQWQSALRAGEALAELRQNEAALRFFDEANKAATAAGFPTWSCPPHRNRQGVGAARVNPCGGFSVVWNSYLGLAI